MEYYGLIQMERRQFARVRWALGYFSSARKLPSTMLLRSERCIGQRTSDAMPRDVAQKDKQLGEPFDRRAEHRVGKDKSFEG